MLARANRMRVAMLQHCCVLVKRLGRVVPVRRGGGVDAISVPDKRLVTADEVIE
jgi:hypothetical protein